VRLIGDRLERTTQKILLASWVVKGKIVLAIFSPFKADMRICTQKVVLKNRIWKKRIQEGRFERRISDQAGPMIALPGLPTYYSWLIFFPKGDRSTAQPPFIHNNRSRRRSFPPAENQFCSGFPFSPASLPRLSNHPWTSMC
jgi:hypothetical protein